MKKLKSVSLLFLSLLLFTGCYAHVMREVQIPEHKKSTSFKIGVEQQTSTGEPMTTEEDLFFFKGLAVTSNFETPANSGVSLREGDTLELYGRLANGDTFYKPVGAQKKALPNIMTGMAMEYDICVAVNTKGEAYGSSVCDIDGVVKFAQPFSGFKETSFYKKGTFKTELIYNGKTKDIIKLTYREFKDDLARAAFTQDLTYDLSESKNIGFKKMKIEVLEVTNSYIKFKVMETGN